MATISLPRQLVVGSGSAAKVGDLLKGLGLRRPLLVADPFYAQNTTVLGKVTSGIAKYDTYFDVIPDPTTQSVDRCLAKLKSSSFDSIVALGGGSAMVRDQRSNNFRINFNTRILLKQLLFSQHTGAK